MSLTAKQTADLKVMALEGAKNANIALALGISVEEVHAARSRLGFTREKAAGMETVECSCCGSPAQIDIENLYNFPDNVDRYLCERCRLTVDYLDSFAEDEEDENEDEDGEETNESEDENDVQDY